MSTEANVMKGLEIGAQALPWLVETIDRFINGDDSEAVRRVIEILPAERRADAEAARQERLLERDIREEFGPDPTESPTE